MTPTPIDASAMKCEEKQTYENYAVCFENAYYNWIYKGHYFIVLCVAKYSLHLSGTLEVVINIV